MKISIKASDGSSKKYRIDIYKANNPDYLMKREYKMFNSEEDAVEYGTSIANGNEVVVNQVKASSRSNRRAVKASEDMSYQEFKDTYEYACKKWPDIKDGYGRNYTITETKTEYQKVGSRWKEVDTTTQTIPFIYYVRTIDANSLFKGWGKEKVDTGYTVIGKVPVKITSTDPSGTTKTVRTYKISNGVGASTRSSRSSIMAATDEFMLSEVIGEKDAIIDEWSSEYDGEPSTSWDTIFDNVVDEFERYCDDEASAMGTDRFLKERFDSGELSESDMLSEFYDFIRFIDISDYDN